MNIGDRAFAILRYCEYPHTADEMARTMRVGYEPMRRHLVMLADSGALERERILQSRGWSAWGYRVPGLCTVRHDPSRTARRAPPLHT